MVESGSFENTLEMPSSVLPCWGDAFFISGLGIRGMHWASPAFLLLHAFVGFMPSRPGGNSLILVFSLSEF